MAVAVSVDRDRIAEFCRRWKIRELSLFGSVLRPDFRSDSDVDVLVTFDADADWGLWDHAGMQDELADIFGRKVDLVSRRAVERSENWIRRQAILPIHVAGGSDDPRHAPRRPARSGIHRRTGLRCVPAG
jgi:predicted nucleotidyltransferase